jgi:hypothetical protein
MILFKQLSQNHCGDTQGMNIKSFPATCSKKDRDRRIDEIPLKEIDNMTSLAKLEVSSQLESRMFVERPSNTRMVLAAMSKQKKMAAWLTPHPVHAGSVALLAVSAVGPHAHLRRERRRPPRLPPQAASSKRHPASAS